MFHKGEKVAYQDDAGVFHDCTVLHGFLDDVDAVVGRRCIFDPKDGRPRLHPPRFPFSLWLRRHSDGQELVMHRGEFDLVEVER